MENINLSDIETGFEIIEAKVQSIINDNASFDELLNSRFSPIALDKSTYPYTIINGRHRVYLARKKGYSSVPAVFI